MHPREHGVEGALPPKPPTTQGCPDSLTRARAVRPMLPGSPCDKERAVTGISPYLLTFLLGNHRKCFCETGSFGMRRLRGRKEKEARR